MNAFSPEQSRALAEAFALEVNETVTHLTKAILRLERGREDHRPVLYTMLARGLHTLKGTAASIGMDDVSTVAHVLEDAVAPAHATRAALSRETATLLLEALDALAAVVGARAKGEAREVDVAAWRARAAATQPAEPIPPSRPEPSPVPPGASARPEPEALAWRVSETDVTALVTEAARLHDLARSLRARAEQARAAAEEASARDRAVGEELGALARALDADAAALEELSSTLAARISTLSSVRASAVVEPLHRLVRDQSSSSGKRVSLQVTGDELLLGRRAAGALRGALVHLVRNAIDHGIEPAALRRERGKSPEGHLTISFERSGSALRVVIEDDGGGLDAERIRDAAVRSGVIPAEQRDERSDEELFALVFRPGFTTRRNVTATSGRGVGLDAVAALVREVGGDVRVESEPTRRARFVVTLPDQGAG